MYSPEKNSFINRYGKRPIFVQKYNANYIHSREMKTLLKTSAKFVETRTRRIKFDVSKMLASEKAESRLISLISA